MQTLFNMQRRINFLLVLFILVIFWCPQLQGVRQPRHRSHLASHLDAARFLLEKEAQEDYEAEAEAYILSRSGRQVSRNPGNRLSTRVAALDGFATRDPSQELEQRSSQDPKRNGPKLRDYQKQNVFRPQFVSCSSASVSEGDGPGAFVTRIRASDDDTGPAGEISYTLISAGASPPFQVNETTGVVTTNKWFDRDEPAREKVAYVTVKATDHGTPSLEAICTFSVNITDVNDNSPIFDKVSYDESVPLDTPVGRQVMRIAATDIDFGENATVTYSLQAEKSQDSGYFVINDVSGIISLNRTLTQGENYPFRLKGIARDGGNPSRSSAVEITIIVASSKNRPPEFTSIPSTAIQIPENYNDFKAPLVTLEARSKLDDSSELFFELVNGQTQQTNVDGTFTILEHGNFVDIKLAKPLDYETVQEYTLTIRVKNTGGGAAETVVNFVVTDVNDNQPVFIPVDRASVMENSNPNTFVVKIQATDKDGTSPNNLVKYRLANFEDLFRIDANTGDIFTLQSLDREAQKSYGLNVVAFDGAPSALTNDDKPNEAAKKVFIEVGDANDNAPYFPRNDYTANVKENADVREQVIYVTALDNDTDYSITYSITDGNLGNAFDIESQTGLIRVNAALDYEKVKKYNLTVKASDGANPDTKTTVYINVENVNNKAPVFDVSPAGSSLKIQGIQEETIPEGPIAKIKASDPDFDPTSGVPSFINFYLVDSQASRSFRIDSVTGELFITKPLDRDGPNGYSPWNIFVTAVDRLGDDPKTMESTLEVSVELDDINDNAPFLNMGPVVWREEQGAGRVTQLKIEDYDGPTNSGPFTASIDASADDDITRLFRLTPDNGRYFLDVTGPLDREKRKEYLIPVLLGDAGRPPQKGVSILTIIVGDINDNPMTDGASAISVFNYKGNLPTMVIGRVYVTDLDDWDLPDKDFSLMEPLSPSFTISPDGNITIQAGTPEGVYTLQAAVHDRVRNEDAVGTVTVTVKEIPEEAVIRSGSMRLQGITQEEFLAPVNGVSKKDKLRSRIASIFGIPEENVDLFTIVPKKMGNDSFIDVRYSAHGSPYYAAEKINTKVAEHAEEFAALLGARIEMIGVDECLYEHMACDGSCSNTLSIDDKPYTIFTNTSSFVGVDARAKAECVCLAESDNVASSCMDGTFCLNGGTCVSSATGPKCNCLEGFEGPRCQGLDVAFSGKSWALYEPLAACSEGNLRLKLRPAAPDGLVLYAGPSAVPTNNKVTDFLALELVNGLPQAYINLGSGTQVLKFITDQKLLMDEKEHSLHIHWDARELFMSLDDCTDKNSCFTRSLPVGPNEFLNVNGPLQLGGTPTKIRDVRMALGWTEVPTTNGYAGCISNVTFNGKVYDVSRPAAFQNTSYTCDGVIVGPSIGAASGTELLIALIVLLLILLVLVIMVVVWRRRRVHDTLKEFNDDIRENIINYSDEGGGEGDMTGYDLSLLRMAPDGKPLIGRNGKVDEVKQKKAPAPGEANISAFLDDNKDRVDHDPDGLPYDDMRHYAYEGEGNSQISLSSLASGTDDGDMNFEYLSEFGPRFKKLADMYGEHSSDESDEDGYTNPNSESWC